MKETWTNRPIKKLERKKIAVNKKHSNILHCYKGVNNYIFLLKLWRNHNLESKYLIVKLIILYNKQDMYSKLYMGLRHFSRHTCSVKNSENISVLQ